MRVAVVGASGNVGTSVLRALIADDRVESILGISRRRPSRVFEKTTWVAADITRDDLVPLFRGHDVVVHLAWLIQPSRDLAKLRRVNVDGSARVFEAVAAAGVPSLVYASSVGAYSEGPKDRRVDESWPTDGVATSFYSRHKAEVERILDEFEASHPDIRSVRLRPGLIFKREAATGIRRLFAGPFLPNRLVGTRSIPVVPGHPRLCFQAVHSFDVGDAYRLAALSDARGAFNVAAEPAFDPQVLADTLNARVVPVPTAALRAGAALAWRLHLSPTPEGWVDMALAVPLMDVTRARDELGWQPRHSSSDALLDLLAGMREGAGAPTPPLDPATSGALRTQELAGGVGHREV